MNLGEFEVIADSLASGVRSGRHLFFIHEPENALLNQLRTSLRRGKQPAHRLQTLNVNELAESLPNREATLRLKERLKDHLEQIRSVGIPQFLVLTKPMLLVRYQIGLLPLYEHYLADGTCAIVVLPSVPTLKLLEGLPNCTTVDVETIRKPFPEVGRVESPLIDLSPTL